MGNNDNLCWGLLIGLCAGKAIADSGNARAYSAGRHDEAHRRGTPHYHAQIGTSVTEDSAGEPESDVESSRVLPLLVLRV